MVIRLRSIGIDDDRLGVAARSNMVGEGLIEGGQLDVKGLAEYAGVDTIAVLQNVEHGDAHRRITQETIEQADAESREARRQRADFRFVAIKACGAQHEGAMRQAFGATGIEGEVSTGRLRRGGDDR